MKRTLSIIAAAIYMAIIAALLGTLSWALNISAQPTWIVYLFLILVALTLLFCGWLASFIIRWGEDL